MVKLLFKTDTLVLVKKPGVKNVNDGDKCA
jgi:hypothetical protein